MSFIDKIMNVMHLNTDDEYDDYDEYDDEEYEEEVVEKKSRKHRVDERIEQPVAREKAPIKATPNITAFGKSSRKQQGMEVCVVKPTQFEDSREVTELLLTGRTVLLNMEGLNVDTAQRIIDFVSGSCFAISGNLQKVSNYIFIITPSNVDVSGDFQDMFDAFSLGTGTY